MVLLVCRINKDMDFFMTGFFVGWYVVFLWILSSKAFDSSALDDTTTQYFWCVSNEISNHMYTLKRIY